VLDAVEEHQGDVVAVADPAGREVVGEAVGALLELPVGEPSVPDTAARGRDRVGDELEEVAS